MVRTKHSTPKQHERKQQINDDDNGNYDHCEDANSDYSNGTDDHCEPINSNYSNDNVSIYDNNNNNNNNNQVPSLTTKIIRRRDGTIINPGTKKLFRVTPKPKKKRKFNTNKKFNKNKKCKRFVNFKSKQTSSDTQSSVTQSSDTQSSGIFELFYNIKK